MMVTGNSGSSGVGEALQVPATGVAWPPRVTRGSRQVNLGSQPPPYDLSSAGGLQGDEEGNISSVVHDSYSSPSKAGGQNRTENYVHKILRSVYKVTTSEYHSDLSGASASDLSSASGSLVRGRREGGHDTEGRTVKSFSGGSYNFTLGQDLRGLWSDGGVRNVTSLANDGGQGQGLIGVLMGSATPTMANDEPVTSGNSSSIIKEALSFTLEAGAGAEGSPGGGGLQRLLEGTGAPYLSALTHNLSHSQPGLATTLANTSGGRELLFANYPSHLLDFAVFCCVLFIVLGVPGNLITIIALVKCKKVHNATAVFIINLTLSDLMFGLFNLPLAASLFGHRAWVHTRFLCLLFPILRYGLLAVSVFTVLAITINRYVMIAHPRLYHRLYTRTWLAIMVVATWVGAFGALVPTLLELWGTFGLDPAIGSCTILPDRDGNSPKEFLFLFAFVLPCVAICVCYARIFFIVHRADRKSHSHGQKFLKVNGKRHRHVHSPCRDPPTLQTLHATPLQDRLQLETLVKLSTSSNSVQVEILEPGEKSQREKKSERKRETNGGESSKEARRTSSPATSPRHASSTDANSLLKAEANGFSGHTSDEGVGASELVTCSPIRICPPSAPESPVSDKSETKIRSIERRPSIISGKGGGTFSQLRGTFRKTRAGSFIARQPTLSAKDRRLLKMILVIFMSFVACYLPITLVKTFSKDDNPILNILGLLLIYLTTCINPIIYVVMSSEYRQAYVSLLTCRRDIDPTNRSVTKIS